MTQSRGTKSHWGQKWEGILEQSPNSRQRAFPAEETSTNAPKTAAWLARLASNKTTTTTAEREAGKWHHTGLCRPRYILSHIKPFEGLDRKNDMTELEV